MTNNHYVRNSLISLLLVAPAPVGAQLVAAPDLYSATYRDSQDPRIHDIELEYDFLAPPEVDCGRFIEVTLYVDRDGIYTYRTDFAGRRMVDPGDDSIGEFGSVPRYQGGTGTFGWTCVVSPRAT